MPPNTAELQYLQFFYSHYYSPGHHPYFSSRWTGHIRLTNSQAATHENWMVDTWLVLRDLAVGNLHLFIHLFVYSLLKINKFAIKTDITLYTNKNS